jgi:glycosyltransferase involved in cell wall biosynthesis
VHNGIAPADLLGRTEARNALQIPLGTNVIGALGELTWNKNYPVLIRAAGILKREGKEFLIYIIGDGEEAAFLQTLAEEVGVAEHIRFLGFVPDARKYMRAFDIFVLPSLKEGLPYVLLEAGAAKLPLIGSRIPGIEEVITHKETGLLFDVHNERGLADALTLFHEDTFLREVVSTALHKKVQSEFSLAHMAEKTANVYAH